MVYSSRIRENPMNQQESWNYRAFLWHAALLAVTTTFTDINTVLPSLFLKLGGGELHLGILTGIMVGVPLAGQLLFAGWLHGRPRKKPYLLLALYWPFPSGRRTAGPPGRPLSFSTESCCCLPSAAPLPGSATWIWWGKASAAA